MFRVKTALKIMHVSDNKTMQVSNLRTTTGHKAFSYQGPTDLNDLDNQTREIENTNEFIAVKSLSYPQ